MKSIAVSFVVFAALVLTITPQSWGQEMKPSIAVGANIGLQYPYCDITPAGVGFAGEGQFRFLLSDRFNLALGLGYGQLTDGLTKRTFTTDVINIDLKGNLYLLKTGKFRPYATAGVGSINYTYNKVDALSLKGDAALSGKPFWSTVYLFGGGFDLYLSKTAALTAMADYRFTSTDDLDGYNEFGKAKDGYLNGRIGIVFLMGKKAAKPSREYIADQSVSTEVDEPMDDETAAILRNLGVFVDDSAAPDSTAPDSTAPDSAVPSSPPAPQQLDQRALDLQTRINERERDIASLQSQIQLQDARIAELQRELAQVQQSPADFSSAYQEGLRNFGSRNYDRAIDIFTSLSNNYAQHKLASNCIYWVGESQFAKGAYAAAIDAFTQVMNYPNSYKLDDATLMLGRSHQKLGQIDKARSFFQQVISQYPTSEYVPKAQAWLNRL